MAYLPVAPRRETPTPTLPPGVHVLPNHSFYVDTINYLHVVGEIVNNTAQHLLDVEIRVNVFNSQGQLLDTATGYTWLTYIPAGVRTCFDAYIDTADVPGWSYYEIPPPLHWPDGDPLPNMAVYNHSGSYESVFGSYTIVGTVRNDHGSRVGSVSPVGTVYDAAGTVLGCEYTLADVWTLDPGQTSDFSLTFSGHDYVAVSSYRLQVDAKPQ
jgi:hypothetical protein